MNTVLETERLLLRPFQRDDLPHMQCYAVRPEFCRFLFIPKQTPESVAAFLESKLSRQESDRPEKCEFAVESKEAGHIVGTIRLGGVDAKHRSGALGFALNSDFQGRGFMTEAVHTLMGFGFGDLGLYQIWATADIENIPSWRLMERVGMCRERELRLNKNMSGNWRDSYLYIILEPEYRLRFSDGVKACDKIT